MIEARVPQSFRFPRALTAGLLERLHGGYVHRRRVGILANELTRLIAPGSSVLDVGSGDGWLAKRIQENVGSIDVHGVDTLVRRDTHIPVQRFDGCTIPFADCSFDYVLLVDVLHHTDNPEILLKEAARVARRAVLVKDHLLEGLLARPTLCFMDTISNARHGVILPFNYWPRARWRDAFNRLALTATFWKEHLHLYPAAVNWVFGRSLHFIACLEPARAEQRAGSC